MQMVKCIGNYTGEAGHNLPAPPICGARMIVTGYIIPYTDPLRAEIKCSKCGAKGSVHVTKEGINLGLYPNYNKDALLCEL